MPMVPILGLEFPPSRPIQKPNPKLNLAVSLGAKKLPGPEMNRVVPLILRPFKY